MSELLPLSDCPFCGSDARYQEDDSAASGGYNYWILCGECGASSDYYETPENAAESWNRRAPVQASEARGDWVLVPRDLLLTNAKRLRYRATETCGFGPDATDAGAQMVATAEALEALAAHTQAGPVDDAMVERVLTSYGDDCKALSPRARESLVARIRSDLVVALSPRESAATQTWPVDRYSVDCITAWTRNAQLKVAGDRNAVTDDGLIGQIKWLMGTHGRPQSFFEARGNKDAWDLWQISKAIHEHEGTKPWLPE